MRPASSDFAKAREFVSGQLAGEIKALLSALLAGLGQTGDTWPIMPVTFSPIAPPLHPCSGDLAAVVGLAALFSPRNSMDPNAISSHVDKLLEMLSVKGIPHVLVGGLALLVHAEGRNTEDIDLIVALPDVENLPDLVLEDRNEWFARAAFGPLRVDFLFTANRLFADVAEHHAASHEFQRHSLQVATPEGLLLLKLFALPSLYRQGQTARAALYESDIALLLLASPVTDARLLTALEPHLVDSDLRALAGVLTDVRAQLNRKF